MYIINYSMSTTRIQKTIILYKDNGLNEVKNEGYYYQD